jgi:hypothetical protein
VRSPNCTITVSDIREGVIDSNNCHCSRATTSSNAATTFVADVAPVFLRELMEDVCHEPVRPTSGKSGILPAVSSPGIFQNAGGHPNYRTQPPHSLQAHGRQALSATCQPGRTSMRMVIFRLAGLGQRSTGLHHHASSPSSHSLLTRAVHASGKGVRSCRRHTPDIL